MRTRVHIADVPSGAHQMSHRVRAVLLSKTLACLALLITPQRDRMRRQFSLAVRAEALLRAKGRCETCGAREGLEFHHRGNPRDASGFNCEVLCVACHRAEHARRRIRRLDAPRLT
jgi:hypothetical protein